MKNIDIHFITKILVILSVLSVFCLSSIAQEETGMEELDVSLGELLNLEITIATKTKMTVDNAPSIVSVITAEEIGNMGARDIVDVLRTIPGFDLTMPGNITLSHKSNIRGMSSSGVNDKTQIMLNGHTLRFFYGDDTHVVFSRIPINNVKHIEIIRGPGSALYGTGAFIGVINVVTKKGGDDPSSIGAAGGSFDTFHPHAEFSYKSDDWKVYVYGEVFRTEGHEGHIDSDVFGSGPISAAPGNMNTYSEHRTLHTEIGHDDFYFSGYFQKIDTVVPVGVVALVDEQDCEFLAYFTEIGYNLPITDTGNVKFRVFRDFGHQKARVEIFSEETSANVFGWDHGDGKYEESMFGEPAFKSTVTGGEILGDLKFGEAIQAVTGVSYEKIELFNPEIHSNANMTGSPIVLNGITYGPREYLGGFVDRSAYNWLDEGERTVSAVYGQGIIDFRDMFDIDDGAETLALTLGVRYDDYDDVGSTTNPRAGIVYAPFEKLYFKALYGTAFRAPSFRELLAKNNAQITGNTDIDPETITTMEALVGFKFTKDIKACLTFFSIEAEDLIQQYKPEGEKAYYTNVGSMESRGVEAEFKMILGRNKYAWFNATYQEVLNTTNAEIAGSPGLRQEDYNPGDIPEIIANFGVNFDISKYLNANVWINYVGERDRSEEKKWDGEKRVSIDGRDPVDERYLVNTSLTFKNLIKGTELQVSGYNLLDDDHLDPDPTGGVEDDIPQSGRSFMAKIVYSF